MTPQEPANSDPIREALRSLPRERASADFTNRLVARLETATPAWPKRSGWQRLAAAATLILVVAAGMFVHERVQERRELDRRLALEQRHDELRRELAALRRQVTDAPTLYLGATSDYDIVLDLEPWLEKGAVLPAAYSSPNH
jgi:hypothetical protein